MDTSRDDVGIAIRSAFLKKGTKQRFSLFILVLLSIMFIFIETIQSKPLNFLRSIIKAERTGEAGKNGVEMKMQKLEIYM